MVATAQGDERVIANLKEKLCSGGLSLPQKYRILCSLRNCSNASALDALLVALQDDSALFRHDVAFALGQRQDAAAVAALARLLSDDTEHGMVRHEAAEALGAIGTPACIEPVQQHQSCSVREVAETCTLASQRMAHFANGEAHAAVDASKFQTVDPTPPYPASVPAAELSTKLNDERAETFDRYRALFALRNMGGDDAVTALATCLRNSSSALLKHEVAYVLGQMLDKRAMACLQQCLMDDQEHAMVRHEAAEALGAVGDDACIALLHEFSTDPCEIVADSCIVALDMIEHEKSGLFEYADLGAEA